MKKLSILMLGVTVLSATASLMSTPASALGGCGQNAHRDRFGHCVFGGQRQDYCIRKTGHPAARMPDGTLRCMR